MATSANAKAGLHPRSNSLPSRPNPIITQLDEHLCRLRASEGATKSSSLGNKLCGFQDLQECVEELLLLPYTQQEIAQEHHEKWADEILEGSLALLDVCSTVRDPLLQTKDCVLELQSNLRRRGCGEVGVTSEVKKYLISRKAVKKAIHKALRDLQNKSSYSTSAGDHESPTVFSVLKQVQAASLNVFASLLSFISGPKAKIAGWSLVSKLMHHKRVASADENEFEKVDAALLELLDHNKRKFDNVMHMKSQQIQLENLQLCIQDLEEGVECLYRHFIKTRVSLLNILNH